MGQLERLGDFDDTMADAYLTACDSEGSDGFGVATAGLTPNDVQAALRRVTIAHAGKAVVCLCGSAYKNKVPPPHACLWCVCVPLVWAICLWIR